jgi:hypothetical protein
MYARILRGFLPSSSRHQGMDMKKNGKSKAWRKWQMAS